MFYNQDFTGVNFAGQNLTNAVFRTSNLSGANLSQANLTNADFSGFVSCDEYSCYVTPGTNLTNVNLSGADARGANFLVATLDGANTNNLIQSNGHIAGFNLTSGSSLTVRDYDGNPAASPPIGTLPIVIEQQFTMSGTGTMRLVFDADAWDSTISFAAGIPVTRAGRLDLGFADGVNLALQVGRTFDVFDWTGVAPTGTFDVASMYSWNLANLYTTGEVTLLSVPGLTPGDFNGDHKIDAADYTLWRKQGGTLAAYAAWRANFGQVFTGGSGSRFDGNPAVPEPNTLFAVLAVLLTGACWRPAAFTGWRAK